MTKTPTHYPICSAVSAVTPVVVWYHDGLHGRSLELGAYFADRMEGDVPRFNLIRRDSGVVDPRKSERGVKYDAAADAVRAVTFCTADTARRLLDALLGMAQAERGIANAEQDQL